MPKILIVDDSDQDRYFLQVLLEGHGHEVIEAHNGQDALEQGRCHQLDLIISDILMPVMDGFRLCQECKKDDQLREMPFVIYSASYTARKDEELALKLGVDRFIRKPMEPDEFIQIIENVVREMGHDGYKTDVRPPEDEGEVLKLYNERLIEKLEQKTAALEEEIKERRRSEQSLREIYVAADNVALVTTDLGGTDSRILDFSPGAERILGYSKEEVAGQRVALLHPPEVVERFPAMQDALRNGQKGYSGEAVLVRKGGEEFPALFTIHPRFDVEGKLVGTLGVSIDITERKEALRALAASNERLELAQQAAGMGMFDWDIVHDQAFCNERYFGLFGLESQDRVLAEEDWLRMVHPDDRARAWEEVHRALADGVPYDTEYRVVWPDNSVRLVSSKARVFCDGNGEPVRMIGALTDITARKEAEHDLRDQLDELHRWRQVTLRREDRVWELKAEVNALLGRLGESPRYGSASPDDSEVVAYASHVTHEQL